MIVFPPGGFTSEEIRIFSGMEHDKTVGELLTVVMPVFNRIDLLRDTLRSISEQADLPHGKVGLVIVDNGSTDGSRGLIAEWVERDAPAWLDVQVFHESRRGACAARNLGLSAAGGEWVMFFDSDDVMSPCHLQSVVRAIEVSDADVICWDVYYVGRGGRSGVHRAMAGRDVWFNVIVRGMLSTQRYCCRRDTVVNAGGWDEDIEVWNDWELSVRIVAGGARLAYKAGRPTVTVTEHEDSITGASFSSKAGCREAALVKSREHARRRGLDRVVRLIDMKGAVLAGDYAREGETGLSERLLESIEGYGAVSRRKLRTIAAAERLLGRGATLVTGVIEKL